ncbi:unnamed protein product [Onchocerca flexuosa]|uniref:MYND-type domain-containing protein n=1 Tax=Onchocerca flexuosa TaxID=387005 RepID=A0A183HYC3_9BILA|nr:unnamed protein product [Onchocerca flexuosa]
MLLLRGVERSKKSEVIVVGNCEGGREQISIDKEDIASSDLGVSICSLRMIYSRGTAGRKCAVCGARNSVDGGALSKCKQCSMTVYCGEEHRIRELFLNEQFKNSDDYGE